MQAGKLFMLNGLFTDGLYCISLRFWLPLNSSYNVVAFFQFLNELLFFSELQCVYVCLGFFIFYVMIEQNMFL